MSQDFRPSKTRWMIAGCLAVFLIAFGWLWMGKKSASESSPESVTDTNALPKALDSSGDDAPIEGVGTSKDSNQARSTADGANGRAPASVGLSSEGSSSSVAAGSVAAPGAAPVAPAAPVAETPKDSCVSLTFKAASGKDAVQFSKNQLKIDDERMNPKTLCVKVDGVPVNFNMSANREISLGAINKASSIVTVRYCFGKATCKESCVVPRDEFMEALAGADGDAEEAAPQVGWTGGKDENAVEKSVERELASFKDLNEERKTGVYSQWTPSETAPSCGMSAEQRQARLGQ